MIAVLAPTLGPTVGGLITDSMNWRWIEVSFSVRTR